MSRAALKNKRLRLEYRYLEVEKEEIDEASRESEMELRKFEWYQQLCEKALGRRAGPAEPDVAPEDKGEDEDDEWEDEEEFDEDMPHWMRWKQKRRNGAVGKRRKKKKIRNLLAECSEKGNDIWEEMPDWFKEMFENSNEAEEPQARNSAPKDKRARKIYRAIVEKSHPDKVGPIYLDQFRRATEAFQSGNIGELLNVADELGVDVPVGMERERNKFLEEQIKEMRAFVAGKKNTIGWLWAEAETEDERSAIQKRFCSIYGIDPDQEETTTRT